ncbi:MAG: preprotein translocase subunit YajC [Coriobacteriia bacterium]|nr:preprotein translocase subunit YajC [Coriobacteriia bacterium]
MEQYGQILSLVVLLGVFYLLIIRPQQKRQKEHAALVASLTEGDRVITIGGMYGTIRTIDGSRLGLEVAPDVVIEVEHTAVASKDKA